MITQATNLIGLSIISQQGELLGNVAEIVFDHENGKILGFLIKVSGFFSKPKVVSGIDIVTYHRKFLILNSSDSVVEIDEIVRVERELKSKIIILGAKAMTESGQRIGTVENVLVDAPSGAILKYYIQSAISGRRIIPAEKVVEITKDGIVFSDDVLVGKLSSEVAMV